MKGIGQWSGLERFSEAALDAPDFAREAVAVALAIIHLDHRADPAAVAAVAGGRSHGVITNIHQRGDLTR